MQLLTQNRLAAPAWLHCAIFSYYTCSTVT